MNVLEIGSGSGLISVAAALMGADRVLAVDINPHAVERTQETAEWNGVSDIVEVKLSDGIVALPTELFDVLVYAAPYWNCKPDPETPLTFAMFDENYDSTRRVLRDAPRLMHPDSVFVLAFATQDQVALFEQVIEESPLKLVEKRTEQLGHTRVLYFLKSEGV